MNMLHQDAAAFGVFKTYYILVNNIRILVGNYFMVRANIRFTQHFSGSTKLLTLLVFKRAQYSPSLVNSLHHPSISIVVYMSSTLTQTISPTTLPNGFPFFSTYSGTTSHRFESGTVFLQSIESSDWHFIKYSFIVRYFQSDHRLISCLLHI